MHPTHRPTLRFTLTALLRKLLCLRFEVLVVIGLGLSPLPGQRTASPVFPTERHEELTNDLDYSKDKQEEEEEAEEENLDNWFDELDSYENWTINLSDGTTLIILLLLLAGLGYLIYRMLGDVDMRKRTKGKKGELAVIKAYQGSDQW